MTTLNHKTLKELGELWNAIYLGDISEKQVKKLETALSQVQQSWVGSNL
jgi:hypothetical protein